MNKKSMLSKYLDFEYFKKLKLRITRVILSGQIVCRDFLLLFDEYFFLFLQGNYVHP